MRPHKLSRGQPNLPEQIAEKLGPFSGLGTGFL